jgi:hypothetical protein
MALRQLLKLGNAGVQFRLSQYYELDLVAVATAGSFRIETEQRSPLVCI